MEQENSREWFGLQRSVLEILRTTNEKEGIRLLQLLVIPSFEPTLSYNLYEIRHRNQPTSYLVKFTRWRRDIDIEKFRTPLERLKYPRSLEPTFESKLFAITDEFAKQILDRFKAVSIPALTLYHPNILMLDGTSYEVGLGDNLLGSRFHWHEILPEAWRHLHDAFQTAQQQLHQLEKNEE